MYDRFLSPEWIFDRCQEASSHFELFLILFVIVIAIISWKFSSQFIKLPSSGRKILTKIIITTVICALSLPIMYFTVLLIGYGILRCSAQNQFYPSINAGHVINALIKQKIKRTGLPPKNEEELALLSPAQFQIINTRAKSKYIYNPITNRYTLFIRPSLYIVIIFDSTFNFRIYELGPSFLENTKNIYLYPPDTDPLWMQLPK